jgi:hypothetical protein
VLAKKLADLERSARGRSSPPTRLPDAVGGRAGARRASVRVVHLAELVDAALGAEPR